MRLFAEKTGKDFARRAAAANLFASYLLGPFQESSDHWSAFRGWTITAASIAWAGVKSNTPNETWQGPYRLACDAARAALVSLHEEAKDDDKLRPHGAEFDDYTRVRNVTTMAAAACVELMTPESAAQKPTLFLDRLKRFISDDRLFFWGEGALSQYLLIVWFLEKHGERNVAESLLLRTITLVVQRNRESSEDPLSDGYTSPDDCLVQLIAEPSDDKSKKAVESHSLLPLIIICARRQMRKELNRIWADITHVRMSILRTEDPVDVLQWSADDATEHSQQFTEQSWRELAEFALRQDTDRMLDIFRSDTNFALMYLLTFQHRMMGSLIKHLDEVIHGKSRFKQQDDETFATT